MSLELVVIGSLVGIALMVALNVWLGLSEPARIFDAADAARRLDVDAVGFSSGEGVVSETGRAALVEEAGGDRIGLLLARGDRIIIRYLAKGGVRDTRMDEEGALTLFLKDFTLPKAVFEFADREIARRWADRLNALLA